MLFFLNRSKKKTMTTKKRKKNDAATFSRRFSRIAMEAILGHSSMVLMATFS
jgi:hypothetical protein